MATATPQPAPPKRRLRLALTLRRQLGLVPIGDKGVAHIARIATLRKLNLGYTEITDAALETLARCPRLEELNIQRTRVTRKGLARLADFPALRRLNLTLISDLEYLPVLGKLTQLEELTLYHLPSPFEADDKARSPSLDQALRPLKRLKTLRFSGLPEPEAIAAIAD